MEIYGLSGKENVMHVEVSKGGVADSLLGHETLHHYFFACKRYICTQCFLLPSPSNKFTKFIEWLSLIYIYIYIYISLNIIDILCQHIFFWIRSNSRITFIVFGGNWFRYCRAESTRDTYNYGQYLNQFPPNTIKVIREIRTDPEENMLA